MINFNSELPEPVAGCTDDAACNYDEFASTDDGSCDPYHWCYGCLNNPDASNYDEDFLFDNGSCNISGDTIEDIILENLVIPHP